MKPTIDVTNGSGWNYYKSLRGRDIARQLHVARLAAKNKITRLEVEPFDRCKPFGIAARFYRDSEDGDVRVYQIRFDEHTSAAGIASAVKRVLSDGIDATVSANAARIVARELADAQSAGFATAAEHLGHVTSQRLRAATEADAKKAALLADGDASAAALGEMRRLRGAHPDAARIGRQGQLIRADESKVGATFANIPGMKAWLHQSGFRASVDDRHHFFSAATHLMG